MGNGQGIKSVAEIQQDMVDAFAGATSVNDIQPGALTADILNQAVAQLSANFGQANHIFMAPQSFQGVLKGMMTSFGGGGMWSAQPQYAGLPWEFKDRLTKREIKFADLHRLLKKLKVSNNEENNQWTYDKSIKRLKRAKWAKNINKPFNPVIKDDSESTS